MSVKIGINGFGRIGRLVFRRAMYAGGIEVVAVNDLTDAPTLAHLLKYDSTHGRYPHEVTAEGNDLIVKGKHLKITAERDPSNLKWGDLDVDIVVESTGIFASRDGCMKHINAGAKKVILTVPPKDPVDAMVVLGVNDAILTKDHKIVSNASCTTNSLAPMVKVLNDAFGMEYGLMTTVHSYTNDQRILDFPHSDLRRSRSAAINIIPTSTGAARAIGSIIPELKGKLDGTSLRVPTPDGSITDLTAIVKKDVSKEEVNAAFKAASENSTLAGYLSYTTDPIVSTDIIGNASSCIFDSQETMVMNKRMVKVFGWYDNEWGYSCRVVDLIKIMASLT